MSTMLSILLLMLCSCSMVPKDISFRFPDIPSFGEQREQTNEMGRLMAHPEAEDARHHTPDFTREALELAARYDARL